jgi:hypothetical protein
MTFAKNVLILLLTSLIRNYSLLNGRAMLISSKNPISVDIKRVKVNETGIIRLPKGENGRSKPLFFQQTLGIREGQPFKFDIEKWQALKECGLFRNLTAKSGTNNNGEVVLKITGEELPSITFSPVVSVTASIERPEATGGLSFRDLNFRGLGQRLDLKIGLKEGVEKGTDELPPTIRIKWSDNKLGKSSRLSVGYDEESTFEDSADILPRERLERYLSLGLRNRERFETKIRKTYVNFKEYDFGHLLKKHLKSERRSADRKMLDYQLELEVEPYRIQLGDEKVTSELQGGKTSLTCRFKEGYSLGAAYDGGMGRFSWGKAPYSQLSAQASTSVFKVLGAFQRQMKNKISSEKVDDTTLITAGIDSVEMKTPLQPLQILCRLKSSVMSSWGGSCLPLLHHTPLGDSQIIRSYSDAPERIFLDVFGQHRKRASAFSSVKADFYVDGFSSFVPGAFIDLGLMSSNSMEVS